MHVGLSELLAGVVAVMQGAIEWLAGSSLFTRAVLHIHRRYSIDDGELNSTPHLWCGGPLASISDPTVRGRPLPLPGRGENGIRPL